MAGQTKKDKLKENVQLWEFDNNRWQTKRKQIYIKVLFYKPKMSFPFWKKEKKFKQKSQLNILKSCCIACSSSFHLTFGIIHSTFWSYNDRNWHEWFINSLLWPQQAETGPIITKISLVLSFIKNNYFFHRNVHFLNLKTNAPDRLKFIWEGVFFLHSLINRVQH